MSSPVDPSRQPVEAVNPKTTTDNKTPEAPKKPPLQPQIKPSPRDENERDHCRPDSTPLWKIILEVGAVAVGLYLAWVYHGQLNQMIESNRISRESLESVQRAFVAFQNISYARMWGQVDPGEPGIHYWTFKPVVENSGATPAIAAMSTVVLTKRKHEPLDSDFERQTNAHEQTTIGPKNTLAINVPHVSEIAVFGSEFGDKPKVGPLKWSSDGTFFVYGWIIYRDVFKDSPMHLTEFCQELVTANVDKDNTFIPQFNDCTYHNCTDENCSNYQRMVSEFTK